MKSVNLLLAITTILLCTQNPVAAQAQTCADENSSHTYSMFKSFLNNSAYEPDHIEGGILNLSMDNVTLLTSLEHSELCGQLMQTPHYLNNLIGLNDISFFKSSNRRFIVHFFLDSLPSEDGLTMTTGAMGTIRIFDENLEHVKSVSYW